MEGSARAEAVAARAQLAAPRAQLHPHFLFNALHTVVQLIPADPAAKRSQSANRLCVSDSLYKAWRNSRDFALRMLSSRDRASIAAVAV